MSLFKRVNIFNGSGYLNKKKDRIPLIALNIEFGLHIFGTWPGAKMGKTFQILLFITLFNLIFQIYDTFIVLHNLDDLLKNLETASAVIFSLLKAAAFITKHRSIRYVIQDIYNTWPMNSGVPGHEIRKDTAKLANYIVKIVTISYSLLMVSFLFNSILSYNADPYTDRRYLLQTTFPTTYAKRSPFFEIVCIYQFIVSIFCVNVHIVMDGLLITLVLYAKTKVVDLRQEISKFSSVCQNCRHRPSILKVTRGLVQKHVNYLQFTENLKNMFSIVAMILVGICITINVTIGYIFVYLLEYTKNYARLFQCWIYITCGILAMAVYCIAGEYLTSQSQFILEDLEKCPWYDFESSDIRIILFVIAKAQKPVTIDAGKFNSLSLVFLTSILKASFSYLSILLQTVKQT